MGKRVHLGRTMLDIRFWEQTMSLSDTLQDKSCLYHNMPHHKIKGLKGQKPTAEVQPLWTFEDAKCCSNFLQLDHINNTKLTGSHLYSRKSQKNLILERVSDRYTYTHTQLQTKTHDSDCNHRTKQLERR